MFQLTQSTRITLDSINMLPNLETNIRFPPFLPDNPDLWLDHMEMCFSAYNITNSLRKFHCLLGGLDSQTSIDLNESIKHFAIAHYKGKINYEAESCLLLNRLRKLAVRRRLKNKVLGTQTPSKFLKALRKAAGQVEDETDFKLQWIERLPIEMDHILKLRIRESDASLGQLADFLYEFMRKVPGTVAVASQSTQEQAAAAGGSREGADVDEVGQEPAAKQDILEFLGNLSAKLNKMSLQIEDLEKQLTSESKSIEDKPSAPLLSEISQPD